MDSFCSLFDPTDSTEHSNKPRKQRHKASANSNEKIVSQEWRRKASQAQNGQLIDEDTSLRKNDRSADNYDNEIGAVVKKEDDKNTAKAVDCKKKEQKQTSQSISRYDQKSNKEMHIDRNTRNSSKFDSRNRKPEQKERIKMNEEKIMKAVDQNMNVPNNSTSKYGVSIENSWRHEIRCNQETAVRSNQRGCGRRARQYKENSLRPQVSSNLTTRDVHATNSLPPEPLACRRRHSSRRRRKKALAKNETLPEESSFLCDPAITTELLVKDVSYIDSYIEKKDDMVTSEVKSKTPEKKKPEKITPDMKNPEVKILEVKEEKKGKKRSSGRRNRRRRRKSMSKELANVPWADSEYSQNWNNQSFVVNRSQTSEDLGKNVNDLQEKSVPNGCQNECLVNGVELESPHSTSFEGNEIHNDFEIFEKSSFQDIQYMTEELDPDDLENYFSSSDDLDEFIDDSSSDVDDSAEETYGMLPPEPRFGNVEYKLQLVNPSERRFQHLVTQLKWRLGSGGDSAVYVVGVRDCGGLRGLRAKGLRASLHTLRRMASALRATVRHVTARRVAPQRAVAEVYIRKLPNAQSIELRVAVMGANDAGKSTLIGVLTQGELDNGRGSARLNMFRHLHEVRSGRTSSLSHEILGFDAQGNVVNYGCSELMTAERIGERSAKLVSFLDLAGHSKYQRTTVHGLTGYSPHYAMLVVSATAGINRMTEDHIGLLLALDMPFFIVVTKVDLAPGNMGKLLARLAEILDSVDCRKQPLLITNEHLAKTCVAPHKLILDSLNSDCCASSSEDEDNMIPVFPVSCVRGCGLSALHCYLLALEPPVDDTGNSIDDEPCEFQIDEIFHVGDSTGPVVGGLLASGTLFEGANLLIGPLDTGDFVEIKVKTIYRNRAPCGVVKAGQSASLGLSKYPPNLRQGMVLISIPEGYDPKPILKPTQDSTLVPEVSANLEVRPENCGICQKSLESNEAAEFSELVRSFQNSPKGKKKETSKSKANVKSVRRKEKNILRDIANVENCLVKEKVGLGDNLYTSGSDSEGKQKRQIDTPIENQDDMDAKESCTCMEGILLEDPKNPRGCLFFQATVRVLRHSTAIYPGFQATVHIGNIRQTAVIEGIMSWNCVLRAGESASVVFRFVRQPEYVRAGRKMLFRDGLDTRGVGTITQVFPYSGV